MTVRAFDDERALARAVAAAIVDVAAEALKRRGRFAIALSGGATPRPIHRLLGSEFRDEIDWAHVDVFWGDDRFVPAGDPRSNYGLARIDLLDHVPCPAANVHPIPTELATPEEAAMAYEATLRAHFDSELPRFDLMTLGIGEDCHTASLFPHSATLGERDRLAVAAARDRGAGAGANAAAPDAAAFVPRVTLTLPVLLAAASVFVVAGASKAPAVAKALAPGTRRTECPAAALRDADGTVIWWVEKTPGIIHSWEA